MHPLYQKYYADRDYEQRDLFQLLQSRFGVQSFLYPGSFVQVSPSFAIPHGVYVDSDRQAAAFFRDIEVRQAEIRQEATYDEPVDIRFIAQDYRKPLPMADASVDLLISQYAGIISQPCKRYLKHGGYLLANNSHADAGVAALDDEYTLTGVFHRRGGRYVYSDRALDTYFIPQKRYADLRAQLLQSGKGVGYTKTAALYLFTRW